MSRHKTADPLERQISGCLQTCRDVFVSVMLVSTQKIELNCKISKREN